MASLTRNNPYGGGWNSKSIGVHLEAISSRLESLESLKEEVAALKSYALSKEKSSSACGPAEFQNPDDYLCSIRQTGTVHEYHREFAKRSARVFNWPDHCLLGVFLNGLKDELKVGVRIHKPRTIYDAINRAVEFEAKVSSLGSRGVKQTSKLIVASEETVEQVQQDTPEPVINKEEMAKISLHAILDEAEDQTHLEEKEHEYHRDEVAEISVQAIANDLSIFHSLSSGTIGRPSSKGELGANAILVISVAAGRAGVADPSGGGNHVLPVPACMIISGGKHGGNNLAIREIMALPVGAQRFEKAMQMGSETYHHLKAVISEKYGTHGFTVGGDAGEIDLQRHSVSTHGRVYEAGQPAIEWLIAWHNSH